MVYNVKQIIQKSPIALPVIPAASMCAAAPSTVIYSEFLHLVLIHLKYLLLIQSILTPCQDNSLLYSQVKSLNQNQAAADLIQADETEAHKQLLDKTQWLSAQHPPLSM